MNSTFKDSQPDWSDWDINNGGVDIQLFYRIDYVLSLTVHSLGLVGNLVMLVVYSLSRKLSKMSISVYFMFVAVICAYHNIFTLARYFSPVDRLIDESNILCKLNVYLFFYLKPISAWLEILAGLDRFLSILYPFRFKFLKRPKVQVIFVVSVIFYNTCCYAKILFETNLVLNYDYYSLQYYSWCPIFLSYELSMLDFLNGAAIPFVLMSILSMLTVSGVIQAHARIRLSTPNDSHSRRTLVHDVKFGVTMIVLNVLFVLFNSPYRLYYLLDIYLSIYDRS